MKTFIGILLVLGIAGYNIWVHYYNNDVDKYNKALRDFENKLYDKSFLVFEKLCNEKDWADACDMLGRYYEFGYAVAKDETKSARLYQKACDMGNDNGCTDLALNYYEGIGVRKDENKAIEMLNNLCDIKHNANACDALKEISKASSDNMQNEQTSTPVATSQSQITIQNNENGRLEIDDGPVGGIEIANKIAELLAANDAQLNKDYKQIMARLDEEQKTEFRNMQRAWVKFASEAKKFFKYFDISEDEQNAYYLDILLHQTDFLAAISAGRIPNKETKGDIKALESNLKEALNDVEAVISDRMNEFNTVQSQWQKNIALKRKAVNLLGLDGDEVYKQEYIFWTGWLKDFATDMI